MKLSELQNLAEVKTTLPFTMQELANYLENDADEANFETVDSVDDDDTEALFDVSIRNASLEAKLSFQEKNVKVEWRGEDHDGDAVHGSAKYPATTVKEVGDAIDTEFSHQLHNMTGDDDDD